MNNNRPKRWTRKIDAVLAGVSMLVLLVYLVAVYRNDRRYIADLAD